MDVAKNPKEFNCKAQCSEPAIKIINTHSDKITQRPLRQGSGSGVKLLLILIEIQTKIVGSAGLNKDFRSSGI